MPPSRPRPLPTSRAGPCYIWPAADQATWARRSEIRRDIRTQSPPPLRSRPRARQAQARPRTRGMRFRRNCAIIMFCGFPVMVATLPALDAMATASKYGTGLRRSAAVISKTRGVRARHIVSFTKKAEKNPAILAIAPKSMSGRCAVLTAQRETTPKNPDRRRCATTIIIPNSSSRVSKWMAWYASSTESTLQASMAAAPATAAPERSMRSPGTLPAASTKYVAAKMRVAANYPNRICAMTRSGICLFQL